MEDAFEGSEETSSLESDDNEEGLPGSSRDSLFRCLPILPSAPVQRYDDEKFFSSIEEIAEPLPPPCGPGSMTSNFPEASAPPLDGIYPNVRTPMVPTLGAHPSAPPSRLSHVCG